MTSVKHSSETLYIEINGVGWTYDTAMIAVGVITGLFLVRMVRPEALVDVHAALREVPAWWYAASSFSLYLYCHLEPLVKLSQLKRIANRRKK